MGATALKVFKPMLAISAMLTQNRNPLVSNAIPMAYAREER